MKFMIITFDAIKGDLGAALRQAPKTCPGVVSAEAKFATGTHYPDPSLLAQNEPTF